MASKLPVALFEVSILPKAEHGLKVGKKCLNGNIAKYVSILPKAEHGLKDFEEEAFIWSIQGFNPTKSGAWFKSYKDEQGESKWYRFQSYQKRSMV